MKIKSTLFSLAVLGGLAGHALAQAGAVGLGGHALVPSTTDSVLGQTAVVYSADADCTVATATNCTVGAAGPYVGTLVVTSSTALTATRLLTVILSPGRTYNIENSTTGGQKITVVGATGTGVTVSNGSSAYVFSDGINYVSPLASGSTVGGTGYTVNYSGATIDVRLAACMADTTVTTCSFTGEASGQTFAAPLIVVAGYKLSIPPNWIAHCAFTVTQSPNYCVYMQNLTVLDAGGDGMPNNASQTNSAGSVIDWTGGSGIANALFSSTAGAFISYKGLNLRLANGSTLLDNDVVTLNGNVDGSHMVDFNVANYTAGTAAFGASTAAQLPCCSFLLDNVVTNGNNSGGSAVKLVGNFAGNAGAITVRNSSLGHPAAGVHTVDLEDTATSSTTKVIFSGVTYEEPSTADDTTCLNYVSNLAVDFGTIKSYGAGGGSAHANPNICIAASTNPPTVTWRSVMLDSHNYTLGIVGIQNLNAPLEQQTISTDPLTGSIGPGSTAYSYSITPPNTDATNKVATMAAIRNAPSAGQTFRILSATNRMLGPKQPINQGSNAAPTVTLSTSSGITTPTVFPFYSGTLGIDYAHFNYPGCQPLQLANISGVGQPIVNTAWVDPVAGGQWCTIETETTASQVEFRFYNLGYPVRISVDDKEQATTFVASTGGTSPGASTSSTLVLATGASTNTGQYNGEIISILSGTGSGQTAKVLGYLGQLTCTAAANASGGNTTYTCTVTGGTLATYTGITFPATIAGFDNSANNGTFSTCSVVTLTSISCNNASGVADTHAATATSLVAVTPTWTTTPDATSVYTIVPYVAGGHTYTGTGTTNGEIPTGNATEYYFTLTFPTTDRHNIKIESEDEPVAMAISQNGLITAPPSETVTQMFAVTDSQDSNFGSAATGVADFVPSGFLSNVCRDLGLQCWHLAGASTGFNTIPTNNGQNYIQRVLPSPNAWVIDTSQSSSPGSAVITQNGISTASVSISQNQAGNIASALLTAFGSATFTVSPYPGIGYIISGTGSNASFTGPMTISGYSGTVTVRQWYGSLAPNIPVETYCPITGSQSGTVLTVSAVNATCTLAVGQWVNIPALANIASGQVTSAANAGNAFGMVPARITSVGTGTGGTGTYNVSVSQTVASGTMNAGPGLPFLLYWQCSTNDGNGTAETGLQTIVQNAIGSIASLYPQAVQVMQGTLEITGPAGSNLWNSEAIYYAAAQASLPYVNGQWPYMPLFNKSNGVSYFNVSGTSNIGKPVGTAGTNTDLLIGQDGTHRTYWGMMYLANEVEHYLAQLLYAQ